MQWDEMSDKERVRLMLERVMGYFVLEATTTGWRTPEFPRGTSAPAGFHWPIAFWNTDGECWMVKDIADDATFFNPLHDMNDAWQILRKMASRYREQFDWIDEQFEAFVDELFECSGNEIYPATKLLLRMAAWTPASVCKVAFEACGLAEKGAGDVQ